MKRGIHHSTALTMQHQALTILSEGVRMSRKCSLRDKFLSRFSAFAIDFLRHHNSLNNSRLLLQKFHRAIARAAAEHFTIWKLQLSELWEMFARRVQFRLKNERFHPSIKRMITATIKTDYRPFTNPTNDDDDSIQLKRRKLNPPEDMCCQLPSVPQIAYQIAVPNSDNDEDHTLDSCDEESKIFELRTISVDDVTLQ